VRCLESRPPRVMVFPTEKPSLTVFGGGSGTNLHKIACGVCGIHLFVEFDFNVASIQFLIIDSYLDCIDIPVNTKNYASKKLSFLEMSYCIRRCKIHAKELRLKNAEPRPTKK
jgi:hypothetical protein